MLKIQFSRSIRGYAEALAAATNWLRLSPRASALSAACLMRAAVGSGEMPGWLNVGAPP